MYCWLHFPLNRNEGVRWDAILVRGRYIRDERSLMHNVKIIPQTKNRLVSLDKADSLEKSRRHVMVRFRNRTGAGVKRVMYAIRDFPRLVRQMRVEQSLRYLEKLFNEEQIRIDTLQPEITQRRTTRGEKQRIVDATTMELDTRILKALTEQRRLTGVMDRKRKMLDSIKAEAKVP